MPEPLIITTPGDREIVVTRAFDAPRELVFLCYSKPELLRRWYGLPDWTMTVCEIDFRVGGRWRFVTRAPGLTEKDGRTTATTSVLYATPEARAGAAASPMATGMEIGFKRLDQLLASKPSA
jgi:hypothetical protein